MLSITCIYDIRDTDKSSQPEIIRVLNMRVSLYESVIGLYWIGKCCPNPVYLIK